MSLMTSVTSVLNYFTGSSSHAVVEPGISDNTKLPISRDLKEEAKIFKEKHARSPKYIQENIVNGGEQELNNNKKRTRSCFSDEENEFVTNSQKKRRIGHSASVDVDESISAQVKDSKVISISNGQPGNVVNSDDNKMITASTDESNGFSDQLPNVKENPDIQFTLDELSCNHIKETQNGVKEQVCSGPVDIKNNDLTGNDLKVCEEQNVEENVSECGKVGKVCKGGMDNVCIQIDENNNRTIIETAMERTSMDETSLDDTSLDDISVDETSVDETSVDETSVDKTSDDCVRGGNMSKDSVNGHCKNLSDENNNITRTESSIEKANDTTTNDVDETHDVESTCTNNEDDEVQESLIVKQISEGVLTESMLEQEKKLHKQNMEEEKEIVNQAMAEWESTIEQQRYSRLQHLLEKSNAYSEFLLERIEKQKEQNEKDRIKAAKKAEKNQSEEPAQVVPEIKRSKRNKAVPTMYNITDYVDAEALKKNVHTSRSSDDPQSSLDKSSKTSSENESSSYVQPSLLSGGSLRDYQIEGVEWLKVLFENGVNGILADEMGLGKTIQCIGLLAHLIENDVRGPFLVTAPLSTLPNWVSEFKKFTPKIPVILYHGHPEERTRLRKQINKIKSIGGSKSFPVVITSYDIIMIDRKYLDKYFWKYVIVDEGHRIKNLKCKLLRELKAYPTANRLLLTGTPLQNNLSELWSLLNFLLPDIFDDLNSFQAWFDFSVIKETDGNEKIVAQEQEHQVLKRLHDILTPFLLRRLKSDVNIDLPRKKEVVVYAPLTQKQEEWYKLFLDKTRLLRHFEKKPTERPVLTPSGRTRRSCSRDVQYDVYDDDSIDYDELMEKLLVKEEKKRKLKEEASRVPAPTCERHIKLANILMLLRKTCNHPYLVEYPLVAETGDYRIDEELITSCGKTLVLDQMLRALKERGHKIDDFNTDPSVFIFLLSTRAGGLGLNLTAADTVILYDSDWNPQQDLQAQDRCHRIGQTKPVVVYRYLTSNTVDQRIVERAAEKRKLEKMVIHKGKFKGVRDGKSITAKEMLELLESSDHMDAINSEHNNNTEVLSKESLNKLLDRSDLLGDISTPCEENDTQNKLFKVVGIAE